MCRVVGGEISRCVWWVASYSEAAWGFAWHWLQCPHDQDPERSPEDTQRSEARRLFAAWGTNSQERAHGCNLIIERHVSQHDAQANWWCAAGGASNQDLFTKGPGWGRQQLFQSSSVLRFYAFPIWEVNPCRSWRLQDQIKNSDCSAVWGHSAAEEWSSESCQLWVWAIETPWHHIGWVAWIFGGGIAITCKWCPEGAEPAEEEAMNRLVADVLTAHSTHVLIFDFWHSFIRDSDSDSQIRSIQAWELPIFFEQNKTKLI